MKILSFELTESKRGRFGDILYGRVSVRTGLWPILYKEETRSVCKEGSFWFFMDSGKYTPDYEVEKLHRAWEARARIEKE